MEMDAGDTMMRTMRRREAVKGNMFEGERALVLTAILGFVLALLCQAWVWMYGADVSPKGNIANAVSFNAALGLFLLSTAAIVPQSLMGRKRKAVFRWSYIMLALYCYFAETVQNFRGVNPRFVKGGTPFDVTVGSVFAFVALLLILFYLFLAAHYFRRQVYTLHPELTVGIRYAMIAIVISFAAGIWISENQGRIVGDHGNIIWLHGLGFHALQALPIVGWLAGRASLSARVRMLGVHAAGLAFLLGLLAMGWQTYLGRSVLELSGITLLVSGCFLASLAAGVIVLRSVPRAALFGKSSASGRGASPQKMNGL